MPIASSQRAVAAWAESRRWLVTWIQCPASCQAADRLHRVRVGLGGGDVLVGVGLLDAVHERVALERRDAPVALLLVGQARPRSARGRPAGAGPSSGAASSRCRARFAPAARYRTRHAEVDLPLERASRRARAPGVPRTGTTARARSPNWRSVDWAAHLHWEEIDGRRVNVLDIGEGERDARRVRPRPVGLLAELPREHPVRLADAAGRLARPAGLRRVADAARADHDSRLRPRRPGGLRSARSSRRSSSSATRWAASSPRS